MQASSRYTKLTLSGIYIAMFIVIMMCTQSFAFGQYQIRIATALYGLSALFPFLIVPAALANVISNTIMGGLGMLDIIGGGIVGLLTTSIIAYGKQKGCGNWLVLLAVTLVPGLLVPTWLAPLLQLPYWVLASSLLVGQGICGIVSMLLVGALEKLGVAKAMLLKSM